MKPFRFVIVGCGVISETHAQSLSQLLPHQVQLEACVDVVAERAEALAQKYGVRAATLADVLNDPDIDAVSVCTPSGLHAEVGVQALAAGKHVILEKPMDVSVAACDALIAAQAGSGKRLAVVSQHRFDPSTKALRTAVDSGVLGKIIGADVRVPWYRTQEYYDSGDWRGTWALDGGGCLINQGVHTLDLMLWLCGPVETVYAQARTAAHERIEVEDIITATLSFRNGAVGSLFASTAAYPGFPARLAVYGDAGSAVIEGDALASMASRDGEALTGDAPVAHAVQVAMGGTRAALNDTSASPAIAWGDAHREQILDFVDACRNDRAPLLDGAGGRLAVATINAIYESARTGNVIAVDNGR